MMARERLPDRRGHEAPEVLHAILREQVEGIPGLPIDVHSLAGHRGILLGFNSAALRRFPESRTIQ
jgi:hypothetical protein